MKKYHQVENVGVEKGILSLIVDSSSIKRERKDVFRLAGEHQRDYELIGLSPDPWKTGFFTDRQVIPETMLIYLLYYIKHVLYFTVLYTKLLKSFRTWSSVLIKGWPIIVLIQDLSLFLVLTHGWSHYL